MTTVPNDPRTFPIQGAKGKRLFVPWQIGAEAWETYARKYNRNQSVERIAERHGFGESEMDEYRPGWREFIGLSTMPANEPTQRFPTEEEQAEFLKMPPDRKRRSAVELQQSVPNDAQCMGHCQPCDGAVRWYTLTRNGALNAGDWAYCEVAAGRARDSGYDVACAVLPTVPNVPSPYSAGEIARWRSGLPLATIETTDVRWLATVDALEAELLRLGTRTRPGDPGMAAEERTMSRVRKPRYLWLQMFDAAHAAGTQRHPETWFSANRAATNIAFAYDLDLSDPRTKAMLSEAVLRVLDTVDAP